MKFTLSAKFLPDRKKYQTLVSWQEFKQARYYEMFILIRHNYVCIFLT